MAELVYKVGDRVLRQGWGSDKDRSNRNIGTVVRIDRWVWVAWDQKLTDQKLTRGRGTPREYERADLEHLSAIERLGELIDG
jgi:hypothetical protein